MLSRRIVHSPLGLSLQALRDNRLRVLAVGMSVQARLAVVYTRCRVGRHGGCC